MDFRRAARLGVDGNGSRGWERVVGRLGLRLLLLLRRWLRLRGRLGVWLRLRLCRLRGRLGVWLGLRLCRLGHRLRFGLGPLYRRLRFGLGLRLLGALHLAGLALHYLVGNSLLAGAFHGLFQVIARVLLLRRLEGEVAGGL